MSSPIDLDKDIDPVLQYAPRWARENPARAEESWEPGPVPERVRQATLDDKSAFSGDRAAHELFRQLALNPDKVPQPVVDESQSLRPLLLRIGALIAVAAGIAGLIVILPAKQNAHAPQASNTSDASQYPSQANSADSQYSAHSVKLVPVGTTEHQAFPAAANAAPVRVASAEDVHVSPPAAQDPPAAAAAAAAPAAYVAQPAPPAPPAPLPAAQADPPPAQNPAPTVTQKSRNDHVQVASTEPPDSLKDVRNGHALDRDQIATLMQQADTLVHTGDFSAARVLLQRAAEAGDANAALELGGTFDPRFIAQLGAIGIVPDLARARHWYEQAAALGSDAAAKRLAGLGH